MKVKSLPAAVSLVAAFAFCGVQAVPVQASTEGRVYHVDCGAGNDVADGSTAGRALRSLERVNRIRFRPGDSILLRRGAICHGTLSPMGSGTADRPITVGSYGSGRRAAINGDGARAAVFLKNVAGWRIQSLDISNPGPRDGTFRTGIYVLLEDHGIGRHYVVDDVAIHDVVGADSTGPEYELSGGVVFKAAGSAKATGFDGIQVARSTVTGVDGHGISISSQWNRRDRFPSGTGTFVPITRVHIAGNRLSDLGGDGIDVQNAVDPIIEWNRIDGFGLRPQVFHTGLYAWNSDRPVMQFNEVSNGAATPLPSPAFGIDAANTGVVYQYNFSHDNGGGFMMLCANDGMPTDGATVRYNVSQNDRNAQVGPYRFALIANCPGNDESGLDFYNNVLFTTAAGASLIAIDEQTEITFRNNVFVGGANSTIAGKGVYDHDLYRNVAVVPAGDAFAVTADPRLVAPGTGTGPSGLHGYRLACGSPAAGAGVAIASDGGRDIFGHPVPSEGPPNMGVDQGSCARR
ncbi:right-handed parallel beta-helix repeat-containing protein [Actinomadura sp. 9N407]|uniref:right-handed parallel beta-helix repeat-containing protein n=1 Tax=Actinomadura sp. 9N407 TaxID=3375154 RepID=UPI0037B3FDF8